MATEGIRIEIDAGEVDARLSDLAAQAENLQPLMDAIGAYMVQATQRRFERETGPDGQKWPRLSPRTAEKRIGGSRRGYDHMLRVKTRLYSSIVYEADPGKVAIGSNMVYAAIQQLGGTVKIAEREQDIYQNYNAKTDTFDPRFRKRAKSNFSRRVKVGAHTITIPARPYLGVDADDRAEIAALVNDHFGIESVAP